MRCGKYGSIGEKIMTIMHNEIIVKDGVSRKQYHSFWHAPRIINISGSIINQ